MKLENSKESRSRVYFSFESMLSSGIKPVADKLLNLKKLKLDAVPDFMGEFKYLIDLLQYNVLIKQKLLEKTKVLVLIVQRMQKLGITKKHII